MITSYKRLFKTFLSVLFLATSIQLFHSANATPLDEPTIRTQKQFVTLPALAKSNTTIKKPEALVKESAPRVALPHETFDIPMAAPPVPEESFNSSEISPQIPTDSRIEIQSVPDKNLSKNQDIMVRVIKTIS